jgi:hypothetical protein
MSRIRSAVYRALPTAANSAAANSSKLQGERVMRTTEKEITFHRPFRLESLVETQEAGTYRLIVDEELIAGLSFPAYKRVATHLEIPRLSSSSIVRQRLQVSYDDVHRALALDAKQ